MPVVICAGLITVDFVYDLAAFPEEGRKCRAEASRMIAGGGALNAAATVASLGGHAMLAGAVGEDVLGAFVLERAADWGVDTALVARLTGTPTARSAVLVTPGGERTIVNHRDATLFAGPPVGLPDAYDAVLADTRWPEGAAVLARDARAAGRPVILDAEAPVRHAGRALDIATHLAFSEQGLADLYPDLPAEDGLRAAARSGAFACVTRGAEPALCCDDGVLSEVPGFAVEAVDTLGAGDAWHGAFALALAEGRDPAEAVLNANAAAAVKVTRRTGEPWPTADEVADLRRGAGTGVRGG